MVADIENPQLLWHEAVIAAVKKVTHIAPPDLEGKIIGEPTLQEGVIAYPVRKLGLCSGITNAIYATTTEVYPDSPIASAAQCNLAQVAAITGALDYLSAKQSEK